MTGSRDLPTPAVALAIGAHPDDVEFQAGATLAKWTADGCVVHHLILTDGSKGTWNPDEDIPALVQARIVEQRAAAKALGATGQVVMLGHVDGELESGLAQRDQVSYWIRKLQPDVVLGHDPWRRYRLHPDHRHAGWLTVDSVVAARDPLFFPDHDIPHHRPSTLLLFEADEPDHLEDIVGFEATKIAALLEHRSQFVTTMYIDDDNAGEQLQAFRDRIFDRMRANGEPVGIELAEAFKLISDL
ncbi:MAG: PIG-L deacetylase family protein [Acidimicrobiales bacterium]